MPQLDVGRLPRPAWPIVAGALARACAAFRRSVVIFVPAPERFADELRPWLAGHPSVHVFSEVGVSFLDRPPAFDESVNKRLEALAALAVARHAHPRGRASGERSVCGSDSRVQQS